jgi:hypothetical protein
MALLTATIANRPAQMSPVNNEMWYRLTSSGSGFENFRYYVELYQTALTSISLTKIGRYKVAARPTTGDGLFSPHTILKTYTDWSFNPTLSGVQGISEMSRGYCIAPGVGYNPNLSYVASYRGAVIPPSDYANVKTPPGWTWGAGTYYYLGIITGISHNLTAGDEIIISKTKKSINSYFDGECKVVSTPFISQFQVKVLYCADELTSDFTTSPPTYTETGKITDVIRIQTLDTLLRWCYEGSRQWDQQGLDYSLFQVKPVPGGTLPGTWPYAENHPLPLRGDTPMVYYKQSYLSQFDFTKGWKKIYANQPETINFLCFPGGYLINQLQIKFYDAGGAFLSQTDISFTSIASSSVGYFGMQVGLSNLIGTEFLPSTVPGAKYYTVAMENTTDSQWWPSAEARYEIVERDCTYDNVRICWLNKMGGYDYFNFSKERSKTINVARKEWEKQLDWNYNYTTGARQANVYNTDASEVFTANTDWLNDVEYFMLQDLFTSPDVFVLEETPWSGTTPATVKKIPIIITDSSFKEKTQRREQVFNLTISYKPSYKLNIQTN